MSMPTMLKISRRAKKSRDRKTGKPFPGEEAYMDFILLDNKSPIGHANFIMPDSRDLPMILSSIMIRVEKERGKGNGNYLLEHSLSWLDKNDGRSIILDVDAHGLTPDESKENVDMLVKFYKHFGFKITKKVGGWGGPSMERPPCKEIHAC